MSNNRITKYGATLIVEKAHANGFGAIAEPLTRDKNGRPTSYQVKLMMYRVKAIATLQSDSEESFKAATAWLVEQYDAQL